MSSFEEKRERVPDPLDLIRISADRYNYSYVLEQIFRRKK
ncbi:hypothetical protein LEP1GSC188_3589 [Leptospira weilii serovar Topaz str. LT2116]|uniref:Uncharacterized protein n=1 Tax=Leptospira weilii serovar Topaz str. LT2116 TaxID=1088540 RepID=M3GW71_9LEPT|nr:hypothetical protein LEP1GSC188_3589 [Leptospira weilii serovar Topaz str. LT2116]